MKQIVQKIDKVVAMERLEEAGLERWLDEPDQWDKKLFAQETRQAMKDAYGVDVKYDKKLVTLLADQFDLYVKATHAIATEGLVEMANNGARMSNPNHKIRDGALARIMQLLTLLGLVPNGRPKKSAAPTDIDDLLEGVKVVKTKSTIPMSKHEH